jgi:hypothetical protein
MVSNELREIDPMILQYTCPVCAYSQMPYAADFGNICPCCGTEFGYDDDLGVTFRELRDRWVVNGTPWFSPLDDPAPMWSGLAQLASADFPFTNPMPSSSVSSVGDVRGTVVTDLSFSLSAA